MRKQVALVRSLLDEIDRRAPSDRRVLALVEQLDEEVARLGLLLADAVEIREARAS